MTDSSNKRFTREQLLAAGNVEDRTYVEASPGSGKTMVAAERFGMFRFSVGRDNRAVLAVSFTRSATAELTTRILRRWGPKALAWPHRVVTLDALIGDLLVYLLRARVLSWPGGHTDLKIHDTWRAHLEHKNTRRVPTLKVIDSRICVGISPTRQRALEYHVDFESFKSSIQNGECTHADARRVLSAALEEPAVERAASQWLLGIARVLIVDEVFDANDLDLRLVEIACESGIATTILGDPWQALYGFRGAKPERVPDTVYRYYFSSCPLTQSFRFKRDQTKQLSSLLRAGEGVSLPRGDPREADVVLSPTWRQLWECGPDILPLAFSGSPSGIAEAVATFVLDLVCRSTLGFNAIFLSDAQLNFGAGPEEVIVQAAVRKAVDILSSDDDDAAVFAWRELSRELSAVTSRRFPRKHPKHIERLERVRRVVKRRASGLTPGLTIHQSKGCEWNSVGLRLTAAEYESLQTGLNPDSESHRALYVAVTRGRHRVFLC